MLSPMMARIITRIRTETPPAPIPTVPKIVESCGLGTSESSDEESTLGAIPDVDRGGTSIAVSELYTVQ